MSPVATLQSRALRVRTITCLSFAITLFGVAQANHAIIYSGDAAGPRHELPFMALFSGPLPAVTSDDGVKALEDNLAAEGYTLADVRDNGAVVPRLFLARVPANLPMLDSPSVSVRKEMFVKTLLPLILGENEQILRDRARLQQLSDTVESGGTPTPTDSASLQALADRYLVEYDADEIPDLVEELLERVDVIPPSLAIGQAALETGWGTSSAAQGQAMFGQMVFGEGEHAEVRRFERLAHAVEAYALNLNTHTAHQAFRDKRLDARTRGDVPGGLDL